MSSTIEPKYDLFVVSDETNSVKALRLHNACGTMECVVRDVRQMKEIPQFLKGVPSLYIRRSKLIMTGTQCLNFLQSLKQEQAGPSLHINERSDRQQQKVPTNVPLRKSNFVSQGTPREYSDEKISSLDLEKIMQERKAQLTSRS